MVSAVVAVDGLTPHAATPRSQEWGFSMMIRWVNADLVTHTLPRAPGQ